MPQAAFEAGESALKLELREFKQDKSKAIDAEMDKLSAAVASPGFKITLKSAPGPKGKPIYCIDGSPETFFVVKQLQRNIHRIYNVKQSSRHDLACKVRDTVGSGFPFEIVRTDISNFYESIDRKRLYAKLDEDQLLSSSSKRFIRQIFDAYFELSGNSTGIPRGVGISAYLSELFLRPVDRAVKDISGVVLYCRYVDDIFAAFARPPSGKALGSYKDQLSQILITHGLAANAAKTTELDLANGNSIKFDYLGYSYIATINTVRIAPSDTKIEKLKLRLAAAFSAYNFTNSVHPRTAFREIVARVKFLTGNTRLKNSKSVAATGIYYNNPIVTDFSQYEMLDSLLKSNIKAIKRPKLRARLKAFGFKRGFLERRFYNLSSRELAVIVRAWKHVEA